MSSTRSNFSSSPCVCVCVCVSLGKIPGLLMPLFPLLCFSFDDNNPMGQEPWALNA